MENYCKNHPDKKALSICHNCGNYYCVSCLNEGNVYYYCNDEVCHQKFIEEGGGTKTPKSSKTKISATIATIILVALGGTIGKEVVKKLFSPKEIVTTEVSDWKFKSIPNSGLSIETPFELSEGSLNLPAEYRDMIEKMLYYTYSSDPISINLTYAVYSNEIIASVDGAAKGAINNMSIAKGVSDFTSSISNIYLGDIPGRMIKGNFIIQKQSVEFKGVIYALGSKTWQILCTYISKEENRKVVNRIINSVQIAL